ncbi:MAG: efflux RND transporter periplasmic adaptor subunit [Ktedonobacteraceae bacterium]|nr:efflux RND transporter periplasmic adaptor subunit [Ktedonobacteraceae bacterium]
MLTQQGSQRQIASPPPGAPGSLLSLPEEDTNAVPGSGGPPWWRRRGTIIAFAIVLLVVIIGGVLLTLLNRRPPVTYITQQVRRGDLALTVSATGPIQSATYNLTFSGQGGKITEINVKVGQHVTKGQVLAQLDKTALQDAVNQQQIAVNNAVKNLNAALASAGASNANSQANVNAANANQNATQNNTQASIDTAQTAVNNAQANLQQAQNLANTQKQTAAAQHTQAVNSCRNTGSSGGGGGNGGSGGAGSSGGTPTTGGVPTPTPPSQEQIDNCIALADAQYNQAVAQADQNVANAQAQLNTAQAQLNQARAQANLSNTTAQNQANTAKTSAGASSATANSQIASAQAQLATAQQQLEQAKHNLENATLKAPHDGIVTAINGTVGGAPGVTSTNTSGTGSSQATGASTFIQIVDLSSLQVQANVNESDTANLKIGEPATFTVNAYGDQRTFKGTVSAIPPVGQIANNVVTYPVSIDVDMNSLKGANLMPNMTANVNIVVLQRQNVLLVPVNAINFARLASSGTSTTAPQLLTREQANKAVSQARMMMGQLEVQNPEVTAENPIPAFVIEQVGGKFVARPVVLGVSDGTNYGVLTGLAEGEHFIVGMRNSSGFGGGGGGGGSSAPAGVRGVNRG